MNEFNTPITGAAHPSFGLAALCIIGGTVAFIKKGIHYTYIGNIKFKCIFKGSKPSLIAGLSLGSSYALSGYLINQNKDYGLELASVCFLKSISNS